MSLANTHDAVHDWEEKPVSIHLHAADEIDFTFNGNDSVLTYNNEKMNFESGGIGRGDWVIQPKTSSVEDMFEHPCKGGQLVSVTVTLTVVPKREAISMNTQRENIKIESTVMLRVFPGVPKSISRVHSTGKPLDRNELAIDDGSNIPNLSFQLLDQWGIPTVKLPPADGSTQKTKKNKKSTSSVASSASNEDEWEIGLQLLSESEEGGGGGMMEANSKLNY